MKTLNKNILITAALFISMWSYAEGLPKFNIDPHDSLLFDGESIVHIETADAKNNCYIKALHITGKVNGKVLKKELSFDCAEIPDTILTSTDKDIEEGEYLVEGTDINTGPDSKIVVIVMLSGSSESKGAMTFTLGPNSVFTLPIINTVCTALKIKQPVKEQVKIKKGNVKIKSKDKIKDFNLSDLDLLNLRDDDRLDLLDPMIKEMIESNGRNSAVKHKKTEYSHEVKINETDTVDIIRVYEGSVEIAMLKIDIDENEMTSKMEKLSEDMQSGKITAEEMVVKMKEFQNFGQLINELAAPLEVNEGFKCTVTKNSRTVEPLGAGDEDYLK